MNIREALWILDKAHTRDGIDGKYHVFPAPSFHVKDYYEAWGVVRDYLRGVNTEEKRDLDDDRNAYDGSLMR